MFTLSPTHTSPWHVKPIDYASAAISNADSDIIPFECSINIKARITLIPFHLRFREFF